ncbi:hypothetical protein [Aminobacter sp. MDW-2]|uniref:hypothetical protein n=1 Tax=Aminobacter sp. MDW-2 TaxID=2666139 RepID=UPI0012AF47AB|nr:hypothetical protein [Aminobacter sp. MDW-2]MRX32778.1 hypothetical protein [Aminobacter sp. MDW-2]QNH34560.1 hypothetical protein H5P29_00985 [Aminobacter sp. MDW-2]
MARDFVPDIIIERGVELWCRALRAPRFDNGAPSFMASGLAAINSETAIAKVDDYGAAIERFRAILTERLKFLRDNAGKPTGKESQYGPETYHFDRWLSVDYGPEKNLAEAATAAGLPTKAFSWKSTVTLLSNSVCASFGYGAEDRYHYPLKDGSWLICDLRGGDMPAIIKAVEDGRLPDMIVERADG